MRVGLNAILAAFVATLTSSAALAVGDFGPDTCMEGFVWREACGPGDHVCVLPGTRQGARDDNAAARQRVQPGGGAFGPDTCKSGFVWREACGPGDHVCVDPRVRDLSRNDNGQAGARKKYPFCVTWSGNVSKLSMLAAQTCGPGAGIPVRSGADLFKVCLNSTDKDMNNLFAFYNGQYSACLANPH